MNFRQIDCFVAVGATLSFSAAAEKLYLSQSTVSQQVAALEKELGYPLFERNRRKVELTRAGSYLFDQLNDMHERLDAVLEHARSLASQNEGRFTLGYDGPMADPWIADAVNVFHRSRPDVLLQLQKQPVVQLVSSLQAGAVDAAIVSDEEAARVTDLHFHEIAQGRACVFFPAGHRFERMRYVTPEDLVGEQLISSYGLSDAAAISRTGRLLQQHGVSLENARVIPDGDTAFMAVAGGLGIFVASHLCDRFAERYRLCSIDLEAELSQARLGLAWIDASPHIDVLIRSIERALSAEGACGGEPPSADV